MGSSLRCTQFHSALVPTPGGTAHGKFPLLRKQFGNAVLFSKEKSHVPFSEMTVSPQCGTWPRPPRPPHPHRRGSGPGAPGETVRQPFASLCPVSSPFVAS